jgi:hypothetical protein
MLFMEKGDMVVILLLWIMGARNARRGHVLVPRARLGVPLARTASTHVVVHHASLTSTKATKLHAMLN